MTPAAVVPVVPRAHWRARWRRSCRWRRWWCRSAAGARSRAASCSSEMRDMTPCTPIMRGSRRSASLVFEFGAFRGPLSGNGQLGAGARRSTARASARSIIGRWAATEFAVSRATSSPAAGGRSRPPGRVRRTFARSSLVASTPRAALRAFEVTAISSRLVCSSVRSWCRTVSACRSAIISTARRRFAASASSAIFSRVLSSASATIRCAPERVAASDCRATIEATMARAVPSVGASAPARSSWRRLTSACASRISWRDWMTAPRAASSWALRARSTGPSRNKRFTTTSRD